MDRLLCLYTIGSLTCMNNCLKFDSSDNSPFLMNEEAT